MTRLRTLRFAVLTAAGLGLAIPQCAVTAGDAPAAKKKPVIADVSLSERGALTGQVVAENGSPVDGAVVALTKDGKPVARTTTNAKGQFNLVSVKSGSYELKAGRTAKLVRLWNSDVAPPASTEQAKLVVDSKAVRDTTVRAQDGYNDPTYEAGGLDFVSIATVGAATGGLVMGIVNQSDLNNIQDDIDKLGSP